MLKEGFLENTGLQINPPNTCIGADKWKEDGVSSGGSSLNQDIANIKKHIMWELQVKFYLRQNEDFSLGDSTSDSSDKLLQRGRQKGQYMCDFGEKGIHANKHIFFQKVSTSLMKLY